MELLVFLLLEFMVILNIFHLIFVAKDNTLNDDPVIARTAKQLAVVIYALMGLGIYYLYLN